MQGLASLHLDKIIFRDLAAANKRYEAFSDKQASERIANADKIKTRDIFSFLQKGQDPETGEAFSLPELISESSLLILGGTHVQIFLYCPHTLLLLKPEFLDNHCKNVPTPPENTNPVCEIETGTDTTATAISSTLFYLLHNPSALEKLTIEILTNFPSPDSLESIRGGPALQSCAYLRACVDESLRMSPGVGGILPREVLPGGIEIDGQHFPPGVDVGVPIYTIQHNEAYHPQPWEFIPERWLVNENPSNGKSEKSDASTPPPGEIGTPESVALAKSAFCPFSLGPRACVGKSMAYKEVMIVIARLVWLFEMRLSPGRLEGEGNPEAGVRSGRHRVSEYQGEDMFVLKANGPIVEFKRREKESM